METIVYMFLADLEELLEMTGLIILLNFFLSHLESKNAGPAKEWRIRLEP